MHELSRPCPIQEHTRFPYKHHVRTEGFGLCSTTRNDLKRMLHLPVPARWGLSLQSKDMQCWSGTGLAPA